jgi:phage terminase large subunit-like protein
MATSTATKERAKPGPKPLPDDALKRRGQRRLKRRQAEKRKPVRAARPKAIVPTRPPLPGTVAEWETLIGEIPGYDPFVGADAYYFSPQLAQARLDYVETRCFHVKGPKSKEPFILERWERAIFANVFGWLKTACYWCEGAIDQEQDTCSVCGKPAVRRYREVLLYIPRKNGKTPLTALIIKLALFLDNEYGAEIYGAASTYKQACLVFFHVRGMIVLDEELDDEHYKIFRGQDKSVQLPEDTGWATYQVTCADNLQAHGWHSHLVAIDELHCLPNGELVEAAETSISGRAQPLIVMMTTADFERPNSICNKKHDYARKVRDKPELDLQFLPVVYEAPKDADWHDPKVWAAANPNLGISKSLEYMERAHRKACDDAADENTFKRLELNIRTAQNIRLISAEKWDACNHGPLTLEEFRGEECWSGLDLAATQDLIAWVLAFKRDGFIALLPILWLPRQTADERFRKARVPYPTWAAQGHIRLTDGGAADYATIRRDINATIDEYQLQMRDIAADRLFQGDQLCQELREQDGLTVTAHGQGHLDFAAPMKRFMELLGEAKLSHAGHPVLAWHAANAAGKLDPAGNIKPDREKSTEKIDGFVAAVMAVGRAVAAIDTITEPMVEWA